MDNLKIILLENVTFSISSNLPEKHGSDLQKARPQLSPKTEGL
jgi:hypothetical protein